MTIQQETIVTETIPNRELRGRTEEHLDEVVGWRMMVGWRRVVEGWRMWMVGDDIDGR